MKRIAFQCRLLTDLVLSSRAATEGFQVSLDYIPGAKFLGLVARKLYDMDNAQQTLDLFHNGCVRFGDAHPVAIDGERAFLVPLSWNAPKGRGLAEGVYLQHEFTEEGKKKLIEQNIQLKQVRNRYLTHSGIVLKSRQNFSIKSAYDRETLSSKDGQMYGYFALQRGTTWSFYVDTDKPEYVPLIKEVLLGQQQIGRSKAAEYGLIEITEAEAPAFSNLVIPAGRTYLYAHSNWCFYDNNYRCTLQPTETQLGLPIGSTIDWSQSQIRSRVYRTWNQKRSNRDADRQIIEKGSVLVVDLSQSMQEDFFWSGIGAHRSEGLGHVLVNPDFLSVKVINEHTRFQEENHQVDERHHSVVEDGGVDDTIVTDYLFAKAATHHQQNDINQLVNDFIGNHKAKFRGITASQWGQVRNIAKNVANRKILQKLLFSKLEGQQGYFYQGQSESIWRQEARRITLQLHLFGDKSPVPEESTIDFLVKLSTEMAKSLKQ